jgi:hypothetical protein
LGGECVQNPCQTITGVVVEVIPDRQCGKLSLKLDFGDDLGVQVVALENCELSSPPKITPAEYGILEMVIEFIQLQPFSVVDTMGINSLRYVDVYTADEAVLVLDDNMDDSAQGVHDIADDSFHDHQTRSTPLRAPTDRKGWWVAGGGYAHPLPPYSGRPPRRPLPVKQGREAQNMARQRHVPQPATWFIGAHRQGLLPIGDGWSSIRNAQTVSAVSCKESLPYENTGFLAALSLERK